MIERRAAQLEDRLAQLEARVVAAERRERSARHFGQALATAGLAAVALSATVGFAAPGQAPAKSGPKPLTVRAPFVVVGADGKKIMAVDRFDDREGVRVYGADGKEAAGVFSQAKGGLVTAWEAGSDNFAALLGSSQGTGLHVVQKQKPAIELGLGDKQSGRLLMRANSGAISAAFGPDPKDGKGLVELHNAGGGVEVKLAATAEGGDVRLSDPSGANRTTLLAAAGGGLVAVNSAAGRTLAQMTESGGSGSFAIADATGTERVKAGAKNGRGWVQAFPRTGKVPGLVIPEYIIGGNP